MESRRLKARRAEKCWIQPLPIPLISLASKPQAKFRSPVLARIQPYLYWTRRFGDLLERRTAARPSPHRLGEAAGVCRAATHRRTARPPSLDLAADQQRRRRRGPARGRIALALDLLGSAASPERRCALGAQSSAID